MKTYNQNIVLKKQNQKTKTKTPGLGILEDQEREVGFGFGGLGFSHCGAHVTESPVSAAGWLGSHKLGLLPVSVQPKHQSSGSIFLFFNGFTIGA